MILASPAAPLCPETFSGRRHRVDVCPEHHLLVGAISRKRRSQIYD
jgi:hypothetical protein